MSGFARAPEHLGQDLRGVRQSGGSRTLEERSDRHVEEGDRPPTVDPRDVLEDARTDPSVHQDVATRRGIDGRATGSSCTSVRS